MERDRLVNMHCEKCCRVLGEHREKASSLIMDGENRKSFKEETTQAESYRRMKGQQGKFTVGTFKKL